MDCSESQGGSIKSLEPVFVKAARQRYGCFLNRLTYPDLYEPPRQHQLRIH